MYYIIIHEHYQWFFKNLYLLKLFKNLSEEFQNSWQGMLNKMCKLQFLKILMINCQQAILSFYFGYRILRMSDVNVSVLPIKIILGIFIIRTYPKKIGKYSMLLNYLSHFFLSLSLLALDIHPMYCFLCKYLFLSRSVEFHFHLKK